jgi:excisionase family DNA binding protein
MSDLLTLAEVAETLRVSRTTAYVLARSPEFPAARVGRQIRVPRARLDEWLRARGGAIPIDQTEPQAA